MIVNPARPGICQADAGFFAVPGLLFDGWGSCQVEMMVLRLIDSLMLVGLDRPGTRLTVAWVAALCWRVPRIESRLRVRC